MDALRELAMNGQSLAADRLADVLRRQGRVQDLRELADAGHRSAAGRLAELLAGQGRIKELRELAFAGHDAAIQPLADLGLTEDLYQLALTGQDRAVWPLTGLLARQGRTQDLRILTQAGHYEAAHQLANLLAEQGRTAELRALVDGGAPTPPRICPGYAPGKARTSRRTRSSAKDFRSTTTREQVDDQDCTPGPAAEACDHLWRRRVGPLPVADASGQKLFQPLARQYPMQAQGGGDGVTSLLGVLAACLGADGLPGGEEPLGHLAHLPRGDQVQARLGKPWERRDGCAAGQ